MNVAEQGEQSGIEAELQTRVFAGIQRKIRKVSFCNEQAIHKSRGFKAEAEGVKNAKFRDVDALVLDGLSHRDLKE